MMRNLLIPIAVFCNSLFSFSQEVAGTEFGIDGTFWASSGAFNSGTVGVGLKYGVKLSEEIILGPSVRYQIAWANNNFTGTSGRYSIYGGGAFIHGRFAEVLFGGIEFEVLKSPYTNNGYLTNQQGNWVSTCLVGGGFSKEFNESWRLNAGIFYDILDRPNPADPTNPNPNSPLQPYVMKNNNTGVVIPVLYRIAIFFPLS